NWPGDDDRKAFPGSTSQQRPPLVNLGVTGSGGHSMARACLHTVAIGAVFSFLVAALPPSPAGGDKKKDGRRTRVAKVLARLKPAIVFIRTTAEKGKKKPPAPGLGILVDPKGIVVTPRRRIAGAATITIVLSDGRKLAAKVVGTDPKTEVAVLKLESKK